MDMREAEVRTAGSFEGGMEALSLAMGMGANGLRNRIYGLKGQSLSMESGQIMQAMTKTTFIAEAMAIDAGGVFIKLPDIDSIDRDDLHEQLMRLHADIGELSTDYFNATRDNEIDQVEKRRLTERRNKVCKSLHEWLALSFSIYCKK